MYKNEEDRHNVETENLKKEILDLITPYLAECAGKIYIGNEENKESSKTADLIFEKLMRH